MWCTWRTALSKDTECKIKYGDWSKNQSLWSPVKQDQHLIKLDFSFWKWMINSINVFYNALNHEKFPYLCCYQACLDMAAMKFYVLPF